MNLTATTTMGTSSGVNTRKSMKVVPSLFDQTCLSGGARTSGSKVKERNGLLKQWRRFLDTVTKRRSKVSFRVCNNVYLNRYEIIGINIMLYTIFRSQHSSQDHSP